MTDAEKWQTFAAWRDHARRAVVSDLMYDQLIRWHHELVVSALCRGFA